LRGCTLKSCWMNDQTQKRKRIARDGDKGRGGAKVGKLAKDQIQKGANHETRARNLTDAGIDLPNGHARRRRYLAREGRCLCCEKFARRPLLLSFPARLRPGKELGGSRPCDLGRGCDFRRRLSARHGSRIRLRGAEKGTCGRWRGEDRYCSGEDRLSQ